MNGYVRLKPFPLLTGLKRRLSRTFGPALAVMLAVGMCDAAYGQGEAPVISERPTQRDPSRVPETTDFPTWLAGFEARAVAQGIDAGLASRALAQVTYLPDVIRRDRNQSEFTKTIWDYLETAVSDLRVRNGRAAIARQAAALSAIEAQYGVPKEIVAAIWGLESSYGAFRGSTSTLSALATLAADSRRADFFEEQLLEALRLVQQGHGSFRDLRGSWAGAMGHTQFMPTSFRDHAVDFDGDGRKHIWGEDPVDALASTAAYLAANGWVTGQPWGLEVTLPADFDYILTGERVTKSATEWAALGVAPARAEALPDGGPASIRLPGGHRGAAFMTFENFKVIETYNTADAYVIAVGHLADRIAGAPGLLGSWPSEDRALTFDERIELQERLRAAGFDPLKIDAKIGPDTLDAIQRWQRSKSLPADGYINEGLMTLLRSNP